MKTSHQIILCSGLKDEINLFIQVTMTADYHGKWQVEEYCQSIMSFLKFCTMEPRATEQALPPARCALTKCTWLSSLYLVLTKSLIRVVSHSVNGLSGGDKH
jgi:hypothetical protein